MGWFFGGNKNEDKAEVEQKSSWGTIKWVGKCPRCKTEYSDTDKKTAIKKIERCIERCVAKAKRAEEDAEAKARRQLAQNAKELRRLARDKKCPFCNHRPCQGTKPKCAAVQAASWESSTDIDVSDPAYFNKQLKWYKNNME